MQIAHSNADNDALLTLVWKTLAGLLAVIGLIFFGTLMVEAVLPELPDQVRADVAVPATVVSGGVASPAQRVEHFHAQFRLEASSDRQAHIESF